MSVTRFVRRVAPIGKARTAFRAAQYDECLGALEGNSTLEAALLAARALLRQRREGDAERLLLMLDREATSSGSMRQRAEHALLFAVALSRREDTGAKAAYAIARVLAIASCDGTLLGEVETLIGVAAFSDGNIDDAEMQMTRAANETDDLVWGCWMRQTRGAIEAVRGNLQGQLELELENLAAAVTLAEREVWLESCILYNLAVGARELDRPDVAARVAEQAATLPWSPDTKLHQFQTYRHLAWNAALHGDQVATFRFLRHSADVAPSMLWKIQVVLDSGFFYRELGEDVAMADRLDAAQELAADIDWALSSGEERFALLALAEMLATVDAVKAHRYLAIYNSISTKLAPDLIYRVDARPRAIEQQHSGVVAAALGDTSRAHALLCQSLQFWESRGIGWRAATASIELARLSGAAEDIDRAEGYARRWPEAWFARRLQNLRTQGVDGSASFQRLLL